MTKKIFRGILNVSLLTMLACLVFIIGVQYQYYDESQLKSLESQAFLISSALENGSPVETFENFQDRITVVNSDGTVAFDNKADVLKMENHAARQEISDALTDSKGYAVRYSTTISKRTCYYAVLLKDGRILRVSNTKLTIWTILLQLLQPIAAIIIFTAVLALTLANLISKKILKPINEINLDKPEIDESYKELAPLISKINFQKIKIKKQISQLTQSRREFEIISENMSEGLVLTDKKGNILTHNNSIEQFFNVGVDINGKNILALNRSEAFRNIFDNIVNSKRLETVLEHRGRYYEVTGNPVFDEKNNLCGAVILLIDITEKEKRERLRREFTANVSHELKTPLTSILGISDMLKSGIVDQKDIAGFSDDINKEAQRLIILVNDIIKLSELDEGLTTENNETVDLNEIAKEVCERLRNVAKDKDITLNVTGEKATINGGSSLTFEMIYNLCDNAIKYNKENGNVTITTGYDGQSAFITVKDTGIGIQKEYQDRIFERFYRIDKSRSKLNGGTGLGLSIVKHIASSMGGKINLQSIPGKGTEITVTFDILATF